MGRTEFEVIPQIKRSAATQTGKLFRYLSEHPSDMGIVEMVVFTLKAFWLPLAMKANGANEVELHSIALWAIGHLENQINTIRRICSMEGMAQSVLVEPTVGMASHLASKSVPTTPAAVPPSVPKADVAQYEGDEGDEEDEEEDGFWEEDLDDPIALADIEADAGFRL
ncbi:MAG: hypothetical protein KME31_27850 [Tolypothrix carrinoi HA7290-LM1]|jgi:hypothetical protein|nr:hypothetical protein [Tolypothrix carrinoi HA7290-LM1]